MGAHRTRRLGKSDFVELRRAELERYVRRLLKHPVVGRSEVGAACNELLGWQHACACSARSLVRCAGAARVLGGRRFAGCVARVAQPAPSAWQPAGGHCTAAAAAAGLGQQRAVDCGGHAECAAHQRPPAPLPRAGGEDEAGVPGACAVGRRASAAGEAAAVGARRAASHVSGLRAL